VDRTWNLQTIEYAYDNLARLLEARYNPGLNTAAADADLLRRHLFSYDRADNRLSQSVALNGGAPTVTSYTYNAANQVTNAGFTYDNNGNLTNDGANAYTSYDRANRLRQVTDGTDTTTYAYDGLGNRISQDVNGLLTHYLLDLQPGLAVVLAAAQDTDVTRYVHSPRGIHAQNDLSGWKWMVQDGLGSVRGVVDDSLAIQWSGNPAPYGDYFGEIGTRQTNYGFTGEYTDPISELLYLRARYYSPTLGVFTALDPFMGMVERPMSLNGYSWVEGNVPNAIDPTGNCGQPTNWGDLIDQNCYYSAEGLARRFSNGDSAAYQAWFNVLIQKSWGELKLLEGLGTASDFQSWVKGHPAEALIAGVAAPLVLAGVVAVAGSGIVVAAGTWAAGYLAYNYGPLQGTGWDLVGQIAGWKNVRWAIDTARCTGNPIHLGGAVVNAMLGINLFQAIGQGIVNIVGGAGVRGNLAALQQSANTMLAQTGRVFENGVRLVENPELISQGFRTLGSNIIELRTLNIGTVTHEITHFFQEFAPLGSGGLGEAETSVVRILQRASVASSGGLSLLPSYWLNPVELHAAAAGGNIFLPIFAGVATHGITVSGFGRQVDFPGIGESIEILREIALYGETDWQFVTNQQ
jgi:RHS repeat-associated protein